MLTIALGSTSKYKSKYVKAVLKEIGIQGKIVSCEVESKVNSQPLTESETLKGSLNRAKEALKKHPKSDIGLGIEVGYHPVAGGDYEMFCCTTVVDKSNFVKTCLSSRFLLPNFHQKVLKNKKQLHKHVRNYKKSVSSPVTNYIRDLIVTRKPLIMESVRNTLLVYLEK